MLQLCRIPFLLKSSLSNCCIFAGLCLPNRRVWRSRIVFRIVLTERTYRTGLPDKLVCNNRAVIQISLTESACLEISCSSYADFTCRLVVSRAFPGKLYSFQAVGPPFLRRVEIVHLPNRNLALRSERVTSFFSTLFLLGEKSKWSAEKTLGLYYVAGEKNPGLSLP